MTTSKKHRATVAALRKQVHAARVRAVARGRPVKPVLERTDAALELLARRMADYETRLARLEQVAMRAVEGQAVDVGRVAEG